MLTIKNAILLGLALLLSTTLVAQKICAETAVYFDSGKSRLNLQAEKRLDSLIALWGNGEVHLELEGHTDSVMQADFNQKLSEDRVASVKTYLEKRGKAKLSIKVFANSENDPIANNGSEQGKARNRRVEIQYVLLQNGDFTIPGQRGSKMSLPASSIEDCSLCNSEFSLSYLSSDDAIAARGWSMETVDGFQLTTGGMLDPSTNCPSLNTKCKPVRACFTFPILKDDPEFGAWSSNGSGLWEPETNFTVKGQMVEICIDSFCWWKRPNWDRKRKPKKFYGLSDSSGLKILRNAITYPPMRNRKGPIFAIDSLYSNDSIYKATYKSVAVDAQDQLWICNQLISTIPVRRNSWPDTIVDMTVVDQRYYRPIAFSDSMLIIKTKRRLQVQQVAYYLKDADTAFAFQPLGKGKFETPILKYAHMLQIKTEKGKMITLKPQGIHTKYKRRQQGMVGKLKKF